MSDTKTWLTNYVSGDELAKAMEDFDTAFTIAASNFENDGWYVDDCINFIYDHISENVEHISEEIIKNAMPFDLVLLGMGEDGHIASLFPEQLHDETALVHEIYHSPKAPSERVTLSTKALSNTQTLLFLITGKNKKEAYSRWQAGEKLPVATVSSIETLDVYLDCVIID